MEKITYSSTTVVEFESTISEFERAKTLHTVDRTATVIGSLEDDAEIQDRRAVRVSSSRMQVRFYVQTFRNRDLIMSLFPPDSF
jgi:hypothetical protein